MVRDNFDLRLALNPEKFAKKCLGFEADKWQKKLLISDSKRMILNCSRQSGKSTVSSIIALHRALYYPQSLILLISPSLRQSGELFKKVCDNLNKLSVKPKLLEDNKLSLKIDNGSRIVSLPSSEETIRGFSGANLIIEDEASRVDDELYYSIRPMLAVSNGRLILMSTPYGKRGHFFDIWTNGGDIWERIKLTASECKRITPEFLAEERKALSEFWFKQEYFCEFSETIDSVFRYEDIQDAVSDDVMPLFDDSFWDKPSGVKPRFEGV